MNYTNEINQIIGAIKDGATAVTPVAKEFITQYQNKCLVLSAGWAAMAVVALVFSAVLFVSASRMPRETFWQEETRGWIIALACVLALVVVLAFIGVIAELASFVAPLPSLLGK